MIDIYQMSFGIPLSTRVVNCLKNMECKTVEDIIQYTAADFLRFPNFGRKSLEELKAQLAVHGYYLKNETQYIDSFKTREGQKLYSDYQIAKLKWEIYRDKNKLKKYQK